MGWTPEQEQCLEARGTVLVSAAAGSGKTTVLIERIVRLITDEADPVDVDRLLVVTFTKAAAAEMKQRLGVALRKRLAEKPGDRRLTRQLMLLPDASISTVHGFCGNLIREHFHRFENISPLFTVGDEGQTLPLQEEALAEVLEEAYATADPAFLQLVDLLGSERSDAKLEEQIKKLYGFMQAHPQPSRWREAVISSYRDTRPIGETPFGEEIRQTVLSRITWYLQKMRGLVALAEGDESLAPYTAVLQGNAETLSLLLDTLPTRSWDEQLDLLKHTELDGLKAAKNCTDELLKEFIKDEHGKIKKKIKDLSLLMVESEAMAAQHTAAMAPVVEALLAVTDAFEKRYAEKKTARGLLDFNDLEHMALQLLTEEGEDGTLRPSALAGEVSERFVHVMVDEYQDTNPTQDRLFSALSRGEKNLFFVGDVKQSIYAFRNATPSLFMRRQEGYAPYDGATYPSLIRLGHNFRSRESVTETVNLLFEQLMTKDTCGVDYKNGEQLVFQASYPVCEEDAAELILVDKDSVGAGESVNTAEARVIAKRIREMLGTVTVNDKNEGERPLRFGDICILLRSKKGRAAAYADELNRLGIPTVTEGGSGFYKAQEVAMTVSLLRFLDNPLADVSLLAVMMSPLFAFTPDDMAAVRRRFRKLPLFSAVRRAAREKGALGERLTAFLQQTERLRTVAATAAADRLLAQIYEEFSLLSVMGACPHGEQRVANLKKLLDTARGFESRGYRGLSAFVRFIDRDSKQEREPATVVGGENVVQVMSVHSSKGLEFPVVFMAGLGTQFNEQDARSALLLHRELGVGTIWHDTEGLTKQKTVQKHALAQRIHRDACAEELRVLYVALTRARERLCMVMTADIRRKIAKAAVAVSCGEEIPSGALMEASGLGDWILMGLMRHPDAGELRMMASMPAMPTLPCKTALTVRRMDVPAADVSAWEDTAADVTVDETYLAALQARTAYEYPYKALGNVPVKMAASTLAHGALYEGFVATSRPAFFSETALSPAERGTAMHQFMQLADFAAAAADLEGEIGRLTSGGFLTAAQAASLSRVHLQRFFQSALYQRMANAFAVRREYAFTVEYPAAACVESLDESVAAGETVLVQGIVDCLFYENGGWVIVDYKTDRVDTGDELAEHYRAQLKLYAHALEEGFGETVHECLLYSFHLDRVVPV